MFMRSTKKLTTREVNTASRSNDSILDVNVMRSPGVDPGSEGAGPGPGRPAAECVTVNGRVTCPTILPSTTNTARAM